MEDLTTGFLFGSIATLVWTVVAMLAPPTVGLVVMITGMFGLLFLMIRLVNCPQFVTEIKMVVNCIKSGGKYEIRGFHFSCKKSRLSVTTPAGKLYKYQIVERDYELGNENGNDVFKSDREFEWMIMMVNRMTKYTFYKIYINYTALRFALLGRDIYIDYKDTRVTLKRIRTEEE